MTAELSRCPWPKGELYCAYHDFEWGTPNHDERHLFEMLILEGAQAGLSWETILNKRENYRRAFDGFDPEIMAAYSDKKLEKLLSDPGIVRNRLKVAAARRNAQCFLEVKREMGSFASYIWQFTDGRPLRNRWISVKDVPARTAESDAMSADLIRRGFKFVGSTICYAFMQATGMVNDHLIGCFRWKEIDRLAAGKSASSKRKG